MGPTKVVISLQAIKNNIKNLRKHIGRDRKILACVKTDAYGHGIEEVSKAIQNDVDYLSVAFVEEGALLRKIGIKKPILVLNNILPEEAEEVVKNNLSQTLSSLEIAHSLDREAQKRNRKAKVHINIDTGMGRAGTTSQNAIKFIKEVKKLKNIEIEGIFTHFPSADEQDKDFTHKQITTFKNIIEDLEKEGINIALKHTANSAAILDLPSSYLNMVRPGLMIYGYYPSFHVKKTIKLEPALSLSTKVISLRKLPKGATISYGRTHTLKNTSIIATLPIGYGNGYSRALSNKGEVIIRGQKAPVVGIICMDQTMVDVSNIPKAQVGDDVVLIGKQTPHQNKYGAGQEITVEEIADKIGTIPYEIVCMIGKMTERIYK